MVWKTNSMALPTTYNRMHFSFFASGHREAREHAVQRFSVSNTVGELRFHKAFFLGSNRPCRNCPSFIMVTAHHSLLKCLNDISCTRPRSCMNPATSKQACKIWNSASDSVHFYGKCYPLSIELAQYSVLAIRKTKFSSDFEWLFACVISSCKSFTGPPPRWRRSCLVQEVLSVQHFNVEYLTGELPLHHLSKLNKLSSFEGKNVPCITITRQRLHVVKRRESRKKQDENKEKKKRVNFKAEMKEVSGNVEKRYHRKRMD